MKTLELRIRTVEEVLDDFRCAFKRLQQGRRVRKQAGVYFASLEAVRKVLTPERIKLLTLVRAHKPESIYELAKLASRDFKNVFDDLSLLERHGILRTRLWTGRERPRRVPEVSYDAIRLVIPLASEYGLAEGESYDPYSRADQRVKSVREPGHTGIKTEHNIARHKYRPAEVKYLFVAEAPPSDPDRFFYFEHVSHADYLFIETMKVLYPGRFSNTRELRRRKRDFLGRFKGDGFYLIDAVETPIGDVAKTAKKRVIKNALPALLERMKHMNLGKSKVVLVSVPVFEVCALPLREHGFRVLNEGPVDFPALGRQKAYREKLRLILERNGWRSNEDP